MKLFSHKNKKQKGFTILFAVLVSSLVLALGLGIISITMKEVQLSGAGRDSQLAFYAADSGAECAFYWDLKGVNNGTDNIEAFGTSSSVNNLANMTCAGGEKLDQLGPSGQDTSTGVSSPDNDGNATTTFWIYMNSNDNNGSCAVVSVGKHEVSEEGTKINTVIDSRGYNTCNTSSPRRLERGYSIEY